jgi:hypothetical protein
MRVLALLLPIVLLASSPAQAIEKPDPPHYVDLSPLALPVIVQGRVRNYIFAYVRLNLVHSADPSVWEDKEPYFRDALVRAAHRTPFSLPNDWTRLDEAALKRSLFVEATKITGPGVITSVEVLKTTPQRRTASPRS